MVKYIDGDWNESHFPRDFGFSESARGRHDARNHPSGTEDDEYGDGSYVERQQHRRGGPIRRARGGGADIEAETLAAPNQSFGQAFAAARHAMLNGGPRTFEWNGKSYTTDLAPDHPMASTGRAHLPAQAEGSHGMVPGGALTSEGPPAAGFDWNLNHYIAGHGGSQNYASAPAPEMVHQSAGAPQPAPADYQTAARRADYEASYGEPARAMAGAQIGHDTDGGGDQYAGHARGGRIRRAQGGAVVPPGIQGAPAAPGTAPGTQNPMAHATITMPLSDAAQGAARLIQSGRQAGARQTMGALAQAARRPPQAPAAPAAMKEGGHFIQKAVRHPGRMQHGAAREGVSTHAYMEEHKHDPGSLGDAARLGLRMTGGDLSPRKRKG